MPNRCIGLLADQYLSYAEQTAEESPETIKSKRSYLKDFASYFHGEGLTELTNQDIDIYFVHLRTKVSALTKRKLSKGSINNRKLTVRVFLTWCKEYKELPLIAKPFAIIVRRGVEKHRSAIPEEDVELTIDKVSVRQDRLMIWIIYEAGLRISELVAVKIEHLKGRRLEVVGKGGRRRITFVSPELANELREWMYDKGWHSGYVFRPNSGKRGKGYVHIDTVRRRIVKWFFSALGIVMTPHQLRHTFAMRLYKAGVSLRAIQKLLGHSNIETTMVYLGVDDDYLEEEYSKVSSSVLTKSAEFATIGV